MALRKTKGRKKLKPISQRGKGERRITFAQSKAKAKKSNPTGRGIYRPDRITGKANAAAAVDVYSYKLGTKTGKGSTLSTRLKQAKLNAKSKAKSTGRKMANWSAKKKAAMQKLWAGNKKG